MGACSFMEIGYGKDARTAYDDLVEQNEYEYGHDSYNGTISTTYGFRMARCELDCSSNAKWNKTREKKAYDLAYERLDNLEKRDCECIDLGVVSNRETHHNGWHKFLFYGWAAE